jgi:hypothetical protein
VKLILENPYNEYLKVWIFFSLKKKIFFLFSNLSRSYRSYFFKFVSKFSLFAYFWIVSLARNRVSDLITSIVTFSFAAGGSRRSSGGGNGRRLSADRVIKPALRRHIICQRCARRYLMKFDKIFYYTRSEKNIPYFYYAARKYLYLLIPDSLLNILINLQSKIDRFAANSISITEDVVIQFTRNLDFRIRRAEKETRGASLNEIEDSSSLEDIFHLFLYTIRRDVKLFTEIINFFF